MHTPAPPHTHTLSGTDIKEWDAQHKAVFEGTQWWLVAEGVLEQPLTLERLELPSKAATPPDAAGPALTTTLVEYEAKGGPCDLCACAHVRLCVCVRARAVQPS